VHDNYDIDLFVDLIDHAAKLLGTEDRTSPSLRVIADHIRACAFLIVDGVLPSNEGRGYVLRRIARRAMRHGAKFGSGPAFFHQLVGTLARTMGDAYPELRTREAFVRDVLAKEGEQFARTMSTGMALLEQEIAALEGREIPGETVFRLYDTYGFPVDLTADVARERGLAIDQAGFDAAMDAQRERARAASRFGVDLREGVQLDASSTFSGYEREADRGRVAALLVDGAPVESIDAGTTAEVVLDRTPFYAESGGQVGDAGLLTGADGARFEVTDTQKRGGAIAHAGRLVAGRLRVGDTLDATVDAQRREATRLNHSATHLLHAALRRVLGTHVEQKGSLVAPDRLRFDFAHFQPVSSAELREIERQVNAQIRANAAAETRVMPYEDAVAAGAIALFGEKYDREVRVLRLGDYSMELCGGTHVARAGDIGLFRIVSEGGVAAGVRRIEAVTGAVALAWDEQNEDALKDIAGLVRGSREDVREKVRAALERIRELEREVRQLRDRLASGQGTDLAAGALDVGGIKVVATTVDGADAGALRTAVDQLKDRLKSAVIVLASIESPSKVVLVAGVTADQTAKVKAGELVGAVAGRVGGRGGGRADFAQAGGSNPAALAAALAEVAPFVRAKLGV
jgi:alanyl-tRNA synthetase